MSSQSYAQYHVTVEDEFSYNLSHQETQRLNIFSTKHATAYLLFSQYVNEL